MTDVLVVYYSRTGTTETVARTLAVRLGAEIGSIEALTTYAGPLGFMKGIWHSIRDATPPIRQRLDPRRYRAVVLCSPVWAGKLAGPARTYLGQASKVPLLCGVAVSGSGGPQVGFFREMERLAGRDGIPVLSLAQRQVAHGAFKRLFGPFIETVWTRRIEAA
ncbi:flavodoxin family protein [Methylorubrum extorquens]